MNGALARTVTSVMVLITFSTVQILPVAGEGNTLLVAMGDPSNTQAMDEIWMLVNCPIQPALASAQELAEAIRLHYGVGAETVEATMDLPELTPPADLTEAVAMASSDILARVVLGIAQAPGSLVPELGDPVQDDRQVFALVDVGGGEHPSHWNQAGPDGAEGVEFVAPDPFPVAGAAAPGCLGIRRRLGMASLFGDAPIGGKEAGIGHQNGRADPPTFGQTANQLQSRLDRRLFPCLEPTPKGSIGGDSIGQPTRLGHTGMLLEEPLQAAQAGQPVIHPSPSRT